MHKTLKLIRNDRADVLCPKAQSAQESKTPPASTRFQDAASLLNLHVCRPVEAAPPLLAPLVSLAQIWTF